ARGEEYAAAPFTARTKIDQIEDPVEDEEPGDREMPMTRAGEPSTKSHPRRRRDILKRIPAILSAAWAERWIRGENLQTAAGHDHEQRNRNPVREANRRGLGGPSR